MSAPNFVLYSVKYTKGECIWWKPNSAGYTRDLNQAGRYSEAEAREIEMMSRGSVIALPEDAVTASLHASRVIDLGWGKNREAFDGIVAKAKPEAATPKYPSILTYGPTRCYYNAQTGETQYVEAVPLCELSAADRRTLESEIEAEEKRVVLAAIEEAGR